VAVAEGLATGSALEMPRAEANTQKTRTRAVRVMYLPADTAAFRGVESVAQKVHF